MSIGIGILLALLTAVLARVAGFDRERAFYSAVLITIATYDILFAVMGGTPRAIVIECLFAGVFVATSVVGFRTSPWVLVAGFAAHGFADFIHDAFSPDAGIPAWWPGFCGAYDVVFALVIAMQLLLASRASERAALR
jgi:hypothetical protein